MLGGAAAHPHAAGRAVPGHRAALGQRPRQLSRAHRRRRSRSSVTQIIEQQLTGIDGLIYFSSSSSADGVGHRHRDVRAGHRTPTSRRCRCRTRCSRRCRGCRRQVQQQGLVVTKSNPDFLLVIVGLRRDRHARPAATSPTIWSRTCRTRSAALPGVGDMQRVRLAVRDAHLARSRTSSRSFQLMPGDVDRGDPGAEHAGRRGPDRRACPRRTGRC